MDGENVHCPEYVVIQGHHTARHSPGQPSHGQICKICYGKNVENTPGGRQSPKQLLRFILTH